MLKRLRLRNFQAHEDTRIVFDPLATTIVGPTDAGKTSIVRALRWLLLGEPKRGSAFVRTGTDRCVVSVEVDGRRLSRRKGKGPNEIRLDGKPLEAFGVDLPEPVTSICNVDGRNFQLQHDSPFWFSLTAGQVSRELNAVVDLDAIDATTAEIARLSRKARSEVEVCEGRLAEAERRRDDLSWVPEMMEGWRKVEELTIDAGNAEARATAARSLLSEAMFLKRRAEVEVPDVSEIDDLERELTELEDRAESWKRSIWRVKTGRKHADGLEMRLSTAESELREKVGDVCPLCGGRMM